MTGLEKEISNEYNIEIKSILPYRDGFLIGTSSTKRLFKRLPVSKSRIMFIHSAKEHLIGNGFTNIDRYYCTMDNLPYFNFNNTYYVMSDFIQGSEFNFERAEDIIKASKALAYMHKASKGYNALRDCTPRDDLGKTPVLFKKRMDEIKRLTKIAKKSKNHFDYLFLDNYEYFYRLAGEVINEIASSNYSIIVEKCRNESSFCHHDFTHNNILHSDGKVFITNFDFCTLELKIYDIANLIRRKMRKCAWNLREAKIALDTYRTIESIDDNEFYVLKLMLKFPQKFWRVANRHYNSKRSLSDKNYMASLIDVINEKECHSKFISGFDSLK